MPTDRPIERSRALVLLIPALADPWPAYMLDDVRRARELGRPIIAVLRSGHTLPDGFDDALIVRADTPAEMAEGIKALVEDAP